MRLKTSAAPADSATTADKPTAYRALGTMVGGGMLTVIGVAGALAFALGSEKHYLAAAIAFSLAVAGVVGGLYPVTYSYNDRLVVRNPFRLITLPWPRVAEVVARLSLVVEAEPEDAAPGVEAGPGRKFTVWSVPVSMRERRKVDRAASKAMRNVRGEALRAAKNANNADSMMHGGRGSAGMKGPQRVDPLDNLAFADQAVREMTDRKTYCRTPKDEAGPVTVVWTWWTVGPSLLGVLLMVLAAAGVFGK